MALFEVPVLSWIFVGLGIVASLLVLSTPAWWDRLVHSWALVAPYTIVKLVQYHGQVNEPRLSSL